MVIPAVINAGAVASAAGLSYYGAEKANRTNVKLAREQMDFQERMSSTAYQRAVQDMKAAGINPMLAYQQGGASSPVGASTQVQNSLGSAVSSAIQARQVVAELRNLEAQNEQIRSQSQLNKALTNSARANEFVLRNSAKSIEYENVALKNTADFESTPAGRFMNNLRTLGDTVRSYFPGGFSRPPKRELNIYK